MDKSKNLIIIIILLVIIIGGVSFYAFRQNQENKEMTELFAIEKEEMENEYTTFATQYDELQVQINNDSLRIKLESEKLKTQRLLEELRQVKSSNAAEITRLKKELKTVRAVLRSYVMQIDSLNRINEALTTENKEVKKKYTEATRQINTLAQEKKNLDQKVTLAAQLDATNIKVEPKNKRGKVIVHTGAINSKEVIELTKFATAAGADGISSILPSIYFQYNFNEIVRFYSDIAANTDLPILIYANHTGNGVNMTQLLKELLKIDNIVGAKDTRSNYYALWDLKQLNNGDVNIINGPDESLLCGLAMGADGGIGATYGAMPELFVGIYREFKAGNIKKAQELQFH
jgi:hypothetical protein